MRTVGLVLVLTGALLLATTSLASPPPKTVLLYGDSLATESAAFLGSRLPDEGWDAELRVFPGASLCGWRKRMPADATEVQPSLVVVALVGVLTDGCNARGTAVGRRCLSAGGSMEECLAREWHQQWTEDATSIARFWSARGIDVLWVSAPPLINRRFAEGPITPIFRRLARRYDQRFVDAAITLRARDGSWPIRLPCLPNESAAEGCEDGTIQIRRSDDNGHLCPVEPSAPIAPCEVYSSGIVRWAGRIVRAAHHLMGRS